MQKPSQAEKSNDEEVLLLKHVVVQIIALVEKLGRGLIKTEKFIK